MDTSKTFVKDIDGLRAKHELVPKLYSKEQGMQWIHHNIQESGRLEDVAPILYANQDKVYFDPAFTKFD